MVLHLKESKINLHEDLLRQKKRQGLACGRRASEKASGGPRNWHPQRRSSERSERIAFSSLSSLSSSSAATWSGVNLPLLVALA